MAETNEYREQRLRSMEALAQMGFDPYGCKHRPLLDHERFLAFLRRKENALRTNNVAKIQLLECGKRSLGKFVTLKNELKLVRSVVHGAEIHLAHVANHHQPSG